MDWKAKQALDASIEKWERNLVLAQENKPADITVGVSDCPLCLRYNRYEMPRRYRCSTCPVMKRTGRQFCVGTPYEDIEEMYQHELPEKLTKELQDKLISHVQDELEFLKSLVEVEGEALWKSQHEKP